MNVSFFDLVIFVGFFAIVIGLSLWKSRDIRRPGGTSSHFFLAGRSLTWPLIGISIVAANISTEQMVGMAGDAAGGTGLAVSAWQLVGSVGIVLIAMTILPRFLRAGIYTMPEFLEYRYNPAARSIMAVLTVVIYVAVLLTAVLRSGGITLHTITGMDLTLAIWTVGLIGAIYATFGGLKAIAWADLVQGLSLLAGGLLVFFLGLHAVGGWESFSTENADQLHMVLPSDHPNLPWTGVISGLWIVIIYYCGLNQFIVQRNLAAKTLRDGQLGMVFAGALWLLVPFAIVMPGIMAVQLYGDQLEQADMAFPTLITELVQPGVRGFIYAAIAGAVVSSLASMLNSASTIFTIDVYKRLIDREAGESRLVLLGRATTVLFIVTGCLIAPQLGDGVFRFIQQFQGFIWPGVVAAFVFAFLLPRAPGSAGVTALVAGPLLYAGFQLLTRQGLFSRVPGEPVFENLHFLAQVFWSFVIISALMIGITMAKPLREPRVLPVREEMALRTDPVVKISGALVILAVIVFYIIFW